jgi:signal transduction histidine kinase/CheY-like chemotaxis protein
MGFGRPGGGRATPGQPFTHVPLPFPVLPPPGDLSASLALIRDVADTVTGALIGTNASAPTGLPEGLQAGLRKATERGQAQRLRRDIQVAYAERVVHADRAAFEARMNARFAATPFSWRSPSVSIRGPGGVIAPPAPEYLANTDLPIGMYAATVWFSYNYLMDPVRAPLAMMARANNSFGQGSPAPSIILSRTVAPFAVPIWSPAVDLPLEHPDALLPLDAPANESRWPLRGMLFGSFFNSIDECSVPVAAVAALADVTDVAGAGAPLGTVTQRSVVVGPVAAPGHRNVVAPGAVLVHAIASPGGGARGAFSDRSSFVAALSDAEEVAGDAVRSWLVGTGGRVWQLTIVPRVGDVRQQQRQWLDGLVVGIGCGLSAAVAAAVWGGLEALIARRSARQRQRAVKAAQEQARSAREQQTLFIMHEVRALHCALVRSRLTATHSTPSASPRPQVRVPLNSIALGLQDLVEDPATPAGVLALLRPLKSASDGMVAIISDVLDLAKLERPDFTVRLVECSVVELAAEAVRRMRGLAVGRRVALVLEATGVSGVTVRADSVRLLQVVTNLLSNAIKFSPDDGSGRVCLTVEQRPCEGCAWSQQPDGGPASAVTSGPGGDTTVTGTAVTMDGGRAGGSGGSVHVSFAVSDNGCGMSPADVGKLFRPFVQLGAGEAYQGRGTGLGLVIAQRIAESHRGGMSVRSVEGVGSTFTLEVHVDVVAIPGCEAMLAGGASQPATSLPPPAYASSVVRMQGATLLTAGSLIKRSGGAAIAAMPLDVGGALLATLPGMVATSWNGKEPPPSRVDSTSPSSLPASGGLRWLVVDDAETNAKLLVRLLQRRRPDDAFLCAPSGEAALRACGLPVGEGGAASGAAAGVAGADGSASPVPFDVVVTDKNMPRMDGVELCRRLRASGYGGVVIGCSGTVDEADRVALRTAGADGVVGKPVDVGALMALVMARWPV